MEIKWFDKWVAGKVVFSIAYLIMVANLWKILTDDLSAGSFIPALVICMGCVAFCYISTAGMLNKTKIIIGEESVKVQDYPLPYRIDKTIIKNEVVDYHTRSNFNPKRLFQRVKFEIHALTEYGQQFVLIDGITCFKRAEIIRNELAKHTQLEPKIVIAKK